MNLGLYCSWCSTPKSSTLRSFLSSRQLPNRIANEVANYRTRPAAATAQRPITASSQTTVSSWARLATGQAWTGTISNVSPISTSLPAGSRRSQPCSSDSRSLGQPLYVDILPPDDRTVASRRSLAVRALVGGERLRTGVDHGAVARSVAYHHVDDTQGTAVEGGDAEPDLHRIVEDVIAWADLRHARRRCQGIDAGGRSDADARGAQTGRRQCLCGLHQSLGPSARGRGALFRVWQAVREPLVCTDAAEAQPWRSRNRPREIDRSRPRSDADSTEPGVDLDQRLQWFIRAGESGRQRGDALGAVDYRRDRQPRTGGECC